MSTTDRVPGSTVTEADRTPSGPALERAIGTVPGVATAEVTRAADGHDRLRISLEAGEDPDRIAGLVAATLRDRFDIEVDPAAITARTVSHPADDPVTVVRDDTAVPRQDGPTVSVSEVQDAPDGARDGPPVEARGGPRDEPEALQPGGSVTAAGPLASEELVAAAVAALADAGHVTAPTPSVAPRSRASIRDLRVETDADGTEVSVTLALADREVTSYARGADTRRGRWRATADATLEALSRLSEGRVRGHIDFVNVVAFADLAVNVSVTLLTDQGEETFLGAALLTDDPDGAVVRATLDAVNRRVEPLLSGETDRAVPRDIIDVWGTEIPDAPPI